MEFSLIIQVWKFSLKFYSKGRKSYRLANIATCPIGFVKVTVPPRD